MPSRQHKKITSRHAAARAPGDQHIARGVLKGYNAAERRRLRLTGFDRMQGEYPVYRATKIAVSRDQQLSPGQTTVNFLCDRCGRLHQHGNPGHKVAHCPVGGFDRGYILELLSGEAV